MEGNKLLKQDRAAWMMSAPALIILFMFVIVPFVAAFGFSFTNRMLLMNPGTSLKFVGLRNYVRLFADPEFYQSLGNNLKFALFVVPIQTSLALLLALLVNGKIKGSNLFRTIFFSPVVISMTVVVVVWALIFNPTADGYMNTVLANMTFGLLEPLQWHHSADTSMLAIAILSIWQGVGFQMVIFLSGLQYIPGELYEAADIDGANVIQQFWYVTLPQLKNTMVFVVLTTTIFAFRLFTQVMVLTQGGPQGSTSTVVYMMYTEGFQKMKIGYASAISVVFFVIVLVISMIQRKLISKE